VSGIHGTVTVSMTPDGYEIQTEHPDSQNSQ
jgi:hypothetical protein